MDMFTVAENVLDCGLVWLHCGTGARRCCWWREMKLTMCEDDIFPRHGGDEFFCGPEFVLLCRRMLEMSKMSPMMLTDIG